MPSHKGLRSRLKTLQSRLENQNCCDCFAPEPSFGCLVYVSSEEQIGAFCCSQCAVAIRKLGEDACRVKSVLMEEWVEDEVIAMEMGGNKLVNTIYEGKLSFDVAKPNPHSNISIRERFARQKYAELQFFNASALKGLKSATVKPIAPLWFKNGSGPDSRSSVDSGNFNDLGYEDTTIVSSGSAQPTAAFRRRQQRRNSLPTMMVKQTESPQTQVKKADPNLWSAFAFGAGGQDGFGTPVEKAPSEDNYSTDFGGDETWWDPEVTSATNDGFTVNVNTSSNQHFRRNGSIDQLGTDKTGQSSSCEGSWYENGFSFSNPPNSTHSSRSQNSPSTSHERASSPGRHIQQGQARNQLSRYFDDAVAAAPSKSYPSGTKSVMSSSSHSRRRRQKEELSHSSHHGGSLNGSDDLVSRRRPARRGSLGNSSHGQQSDTNRHQHRQKDLLGGSNHSGNFTSGEDYGYDNSERQGHRTMRRGSIGHRSTTSKSGGPPQSPRGERPVHRQEIGSVATRRRRSIGGREDMSEQEQLEELGYGYAVPDQHHASPPSSRPGRRGSIGGSSSRRRGSIGGRDPSLQAQRDELGYGDATPDNNCASPRAARSGRRGSIGGSSSRRRGSIGAREDMSLQAQREALGYGDAAPDHDHSSPPQVGRKGRRGSIGGGAASAARGYRGENEDLGYGDAQPDSASLRRNGSVRRGSIGGGSSSRRRGSIGGPSSMTRQNSRDRLGAPAMSRQNSRDRLGAPAMARQNSRDRLGAPAMSRQNSRDRLGAPGLARQNSRDGMARQNSRDRLGCEGAAPPSSATSPRSSRPSRRGSVGRRGSISGGTSKQYTSEYDSKTVATAATEDSSNSYEHETKDHHEHSMFANLYGDGNATSAKTTSTNSRRRTSRRASIY